MNIVMRSRVLSVCLGMILEAAEVQAGVSCSWTTKVSTGYLAKVGVNLYDSPTVFNDFGCSSGTFGGGIWTSTGVDGDEYGSTFAEEWDVYAFWTHQYKHVRVKLIAAYYALNDLEHFQDDVWVLDGEIEFPTVPVLQPYLAIRQFGEIGSESPKSGRFLWLGATRSQPLGFTLGIATAKLSIDVHGAYSDGALGQDSGLVFWRGTIGLPIPLTKQLIVIPSVLYQLPASGQKERRRPYTTEDEFVASMTFSYLF